MVFGFWFLGFGVWVLEFGVWGLGFGVWGSGFRASLGHALSFLTTTLPEAMRVGLLFGVAGRT